MDIWDISKEFFEWAFKQEQSFSIFYTAMPGRPVAFRPDDLPHQIFNEYCC